MNVLRRAALILVLIVSAIDARAGEAQPEAPPVRVLVGLGVAGLDLPGAVLSAGIAVEGRRVLVLAEGFAERDTSHADFFAGAAAGAALTQSEHCPYVLGGAGYLARGTIETSGHDAVVLSAELGEILFRSRRVGQFWLGARAFVPVKEMASFGGSPRLPWVSLNLRAWF